MKTKLHFLIATLLTMLNIFSSKAEQKPINIIREPTPPGSEVIHRDPSQIPITCFLEDDACLVVNFLDIIGAVAIEVENHTTGEYNQTIVNAVAGPVVFPISGTAGYWSITFILTDGTIYQGNFII